MTTDAAAVDATGSDEFEISESRRQELLRAHTVLDPDNEHAAPHCFPRLFNISTGMTFNAVIRALSPQPPEYVTIPMPFDLSDQSASLLVAVTRWNMLWETAQFRRRLFSEDELPALVRDVADRGDVNVMFIPRTRSRYHEYAPLYHLLPKAMLARHGLPLLRGGQWPFLTELAPVDRYLPDDFEARLARAWAAAVWRHLMPGSAMSGFTDDDPIRLLAHNLDFWLPPVTEVIQQELRELPLVDKGVIEYPPTLEDGSVFTEALVGNPRVGSDVWRGEEDAAAVVEWTVQEADADGRLRGILDAVRSNRVEDDFSQRWTFAREDFERRLYRKRAKIKVRFVELTDTIPVQGPETEVVDRMVFGDFMALLNERDREVVVLLYSGMTSLTEIADVMGYRNHSAVSKRLSRIREQASQFFDER